MATKITENFTLQEFTDSPEAKKHNIVNTPSAIEYANIQMLCMNVLQPLRDKYGKSIRISSGFRSPLLNTVIGGAKSSQHCKGQAADIQDSAGVKIGGNAKFANNMELFKTLYKMGGFDQLILERPDNLGRPQWIHVSYNPNLKKQRGQVLIEIRLKNKSTYKPYTLKES